MIWNKRKKEIFNQNSMKKKNLKNEEKLRNFWDNFKCSTIQIIGMPEGEEEEEEIENLLEKIMENFSKEIDIQVQEAQRVSNKLDPKKNTPRHITLNYPCLLYTSDAADDDYTV